MCDCFLIKYTVDGITSNFTYTKKDITFEMMIDELINSGSLSPNNYIVMSNNETVLPIKSQINKYTDITICTANLNSDSESQSSDSSESESSDESNEIENSNYNQRRKSEEFISMSSDLLIETPRRKSCDDQPEIPRKQRKEEKKKAKKEKKAEKKLIKEQKKEEKKRKKEEKKLKKEEAKLKKQKEKEIKKSQKDSSSSQSDNENREQMPKKEFHKSKKKHDKRLKRYLKKYGERRSSFDSDSDESNHESKNKTTVHAQSDPVHQAKRNIAYFQISQPHSIIEYNYRDSDTIENACLFIGLNQRAFRVTILCRGHILNKCVPMSSLLSSKEDPLIAVLERRTVMKIQSARGCLKLHRAEMEKNHKDNLNEEENSAS